MGAFLRFLAGLAGLAGLARLLRGNRPTAGAPEAFPAPRASVPAPALADVDPEEAPLEDDAGDALLDGEDPAEALRRRLAAARAAEGTPETGGETAAGTAPAPDDPAADDLSGTEETAPSALERVATGTSETESAETESAETDRMPMEERRALVHARALEAIAAMKAAER